MSKTSPIDEIRSTFRSFLEKELPAKMPNSWRFLMKDAVYSFQRKCYPWLGRARLWHVLALDLRWADYPSFAWTTGHGIVRKSWRVCDTVYRVSDKYETLLQLLKILPSHQGKKAA